MPIFEYKAMSADGGTNQRACVPVTGLMADDRSGGSTQAGAHQRAVLCMVHPRAAGEAAQQEEQSGRKQGP